ncbi:MAG: flagellar hook protein FlgE [Gammaproteobacteria bacterium]|nr:flagellar hook protein FlgE [Pseudomonadales bacterium]MCP5349026.1 flagellar hook protein FlgE [Pseudomonadales bacterium]
MSFDTAISGIKAASTNLGIIGNNIANAGTTGFKSSRGEFADLFATSKLGTGSNAIGKGVQVKSVNQSFTQGNITFTDNVLDMAISGTGFFVLSDDGAQVYSRAGNFQVDREGYVGNSSGHRLMVFNTNTDGDTSGGISELKIDTSQIQPNATGNVEFTANLDSREVLPAVAWPGAGFDAFALPPTAPDADMFNASTAATIYDSLGNAHTLSLYFSRTATGNEWEIHTLIDGVSQSGPDVLQFTDTGLIDSASLPFELNISGWTPLDSTGAANGAATQDFIIDLSHLTQYGDFFSVSDIQQDGYATGQLTGVEVGDTGIVFARFSNGKSRALGQVALADFSNASGLQPIGNNVWSETFASGQPILGAPGAGGLGLVQSGALEESNVEITQELVNMIVAQRNFQANAKVIQTQDAVNQTVINLR